MKRLITAFAHEFGLNLTPQRMQEVSVILESLACAASQPDDRGYQAFLKLAQTKNKTGLNQPAPVSQAAVQAFSDGACSGNPGPGGWGAVIVTAGQEIPLSGGETLTTNNRMELAGAIGALQYILDKNLPGPITLTTDSQYVKNGINAWINNWRRNGWQTAAKEPVKNKDLWQKLDALNQKLKPQWFWVKGHKGHYYNEKSDALAVAQRDRYAKKPS